MRMNNEYIDEARKDSEKSKVNEQFDELLEITSMKIECVTCVLKMNSISNNVGFENKRIRI